MTAGHETSRFYRLPRFGRQIRPLSVRSVNRCIMVRQSRRDDRLPVLLRLNLFLRLWRASGVTGRAVAIFIPQKDLDSPFFQPSSAFRTVLRQGFTDFHNRFLSVDTAGIRADFSKFDGLAPAALRAADIINLRLGPPAQPPRPVRRCHTVPARRCVS